MLFTKIGHLSPYFTPTAAYNGITVGKTSVLNISSTSNVTAQPDLAIAEPIFDISAPLYMCGAAPYLDMHAPLPCLLHPQMWLPDFMCCHSSGTRNIEAREPCPFSVYDAFNFILFQNFLK